MKRVVHINTEENYTIDRPIACPFRYTNMRHDQCTVRGGRGCFLVEFPEYCPLEGVEE